MKLRSLLPQLGLRSKLALVALVLLVLPWAGYEYVREMERFLLEGQEQALLGAARAVATALHDRPALLRAPPPRDTDMRREAEEELRRLAAERGEPQPDEGGESTLIIDREESAGRRETEEVGEILRGVERTTSRIWVVTRDLRVLALAGSLAAKKKVPAGLGTLPTHTPLFVFFLIGVVVIVGALTFIPALALGPVVEHLVLYGVK